MPDCILSLCALSLTTVLVYCMCDGFIPDDYHFNLIPLCLLSVYNTEFKRISTVPLQSKFLSQLDLHSDKLMKLFEKRGGQLGEKLKTINAQMAVSRQCTPVVDFKMKQVLN